MVKKKEEQKRDSQIVISLSGPKGCGKDLLADYAIEKMGVKSKIATATPLKVLCSKIFRIPPEFFNELKDSQFPRQVMIKDSHVRKILDFMDEVIPKSIKDSNNLNFRKIGVQRFSDRYVKTPRELLQFVGTDIMVKLYPYIHCMAAYKNIVGKTGTFFITDVRFKHEFDYCKEIFPFYYPVKIVGRNEVKDGLEEHRSEKEWKGLEFYSEIDNSSTPQKFYSNAVEVFKNIKQDVEKRLDEMSEIEKFKLQEYFSLGLKNSVDEKLEKGDVKNGKFVFSTKNNSEKHIVRW